MNVAINHKEKSTATPCEHPKVGAVSVFTRGP